MTKHTIKSLLMEGCGQLLKHEASNYLKNKFDARKFIK